MLSEEEEQKKVVQYLRLLENKKKIVTFFAPVNENKQSKANRTMAIRLATKAKAVGKRAGVSDLVIIFKSEVLFLEMKVAPKVLKSGKLSFTNSKVSDNQIDFLKSVCESDVCDGIVCFGFNDAKEKIDLKIKELEND